MKAFKTGLVVAVVGVLAVPLAADLAPTRAVQATVEIPEAELLDVGIQIFKPGLPPKPTVELEEKGIFEDVRKAESRYIPVRLMETLQATGQWGAVRVVPTGVESLEVALRGTILSSNGKELSLEIRAWDASGRTWLKKKYTDEADPQAYGEGEDIGREPFQNLYNHIANDLLKARRKIDRDELVGLRELARLRFAADLAPDAFGDHLAENRKGRLRTVRLPAAEDPMLARIVEIRQRDYLFIDTLSEHYVQFQASMSEPYDYWRRYSYEEQLALEKLRRSARTRKILGALSILGGVLISDNSRAGRAAGQAGVVGGMAAIQSGIYKSQEARLHVEALRELAGSFDAEVAPLLIDVEGQTLRLRGSAETQYLTWRQLLRDLFVNETGMRVDPDSGELIGLPEVED